MAQEDVRRTVGHVARLAELFVVMGRVHWLEKGIMVVVLVIVIIAMGLGAYILLQSILSYKACNCQ